MRRFTAASHELTLALIVFSLTVAPGCEKFKRLTVRKAPQGVTHRSYTIPLNGYDYTVDVKAPQAEVMQYVTDPTHFIVNLGDSKGPLWQGERPVVGDSFRVSARLLGLEFKGRVIIVKSDEHRIWMALDNPYAFISLRFGFDPIKAGTRLSFNGHYELPGEGKALDKVVDFRAIADRMIHNFDLTLARLQANFDPTLDPEQLVANGQRGESFQSLLQIYETETWVDAPPSAVEKWVTAPEQMPILFPELKSDPERVAQYASSPVGGVTYVPATFHSGILHTKMDCFAVKMGKGDGPRVRVYVVGYGMIIVIEMYTRAEAGGSVVRARTVSEIPASLGPEGMDMLLFISGIPKILQERLMIIKNGVEKKS